MPTVSLGARFRVGPWTVLADECRISSPGRDVHLRPLLMDLLVLLASRADAVVSKDAIFESVWQRQFVTDSALTRSVAELRAHLGDTLRPPRFIQTVSKRGYRFVAPVHACDERPSPRVAVLPFANLGLAPGDECVADAIVDALITSLGKRAELRVISRQSVLHLKHAQAAIPEIARELRVDAVVTGTVQHVGPRVRVLAQLTQVAPEHQLWAESYESDFGDVLGVEDQVADAVARAVAGALAPAPPVDAPAGDEVSSRTARLAYARARETSAALTPAALEASVEHLHRAIKADPLFAPAYHELAATLASMGFWGYLSPAEAFNSAEEAAAIATTLDDSLSTGHVALALVRWMKDRDLRGAEDELRRAVSLNSSNETAHLAYALFLSTVKGDRERALREVALAIDADPMALATTSTAGWIFLFVGDCARASAQAQHALSMFPGALHGHYVLGWASGRSGRWSEAVAHFEASVRLSRDPISVGYLGHALGRAGRRPEAVALLDELRAREMHERVPPYALAVLHAGLGEVDQAFARLAQCDEERESRVFWLAVIPASDPLRADPRFDAYLARLGLPVVA